MFNLLDHGPRHRIGTKLEQDGTLVVKTVVQDSDVQASTAALRQAEAIRTGDPAPLAPDGAEAIYAFQIEPTLWARFKREHPDIYEGIMSRDQITRERACATLAAMRPQWVACAPKVAPIRQREAVAA
jgi:hypothetical protein